MLTVFHTFSMQCLKHKPSKVVIIFLHLFILGLVPVGENVLVRSQVLDWKKKYIYMYIQFLSQFGKFKKLSETSGSFWQWLPPCCSISLLQLWSKVTFPKTQLVSWADSHDYLWLGRKSHRLPATDRYCQDFVGTDTNSNSAYQNLSILLFILLILLYNLVQRLNIITWRDV